MPVAATRRRYLVDRAREHLHPDFSDFSATGSRSTSSLRDAALDRHLPLGRRVRRRPVPHPATPTIENGGDRHIMMWDIEGCDLYELFNAAVRRAWHAGSGGPGICARMPSDPMAGPAPTRQDCRSCRASCATTRSRRRDPSRAPVHRAGQRGAYMYPARHHAGDGNAMSLPPMGLRVRLKADFDIAGFGPQAQVILPAEELRDDPGRQRLAVVRHRRAASAGTTTSSTTSTSSMAPTSRSSTPGIHQQAVASPRLHPDRHDPGHDHQADGVVRAVDREPQPWMRLVGIEGRARRSACASGRGRRRRPARARSLRPACQNPDLPPATRPPSP